MYHDKIPRLKVVALFLMVILFAGSIQYVSAAPKFGSVQTATWDTSGFGDSSVAVLANGSNVYVAYNNENDGTPNSFAIQVARSANNGTSFATLATAVSTCTPIGALTCSVDDTKPSLAVSGKYLYIAWLDGRQNIAFARSDDSGISFAGVAPTELTTVVSPQGAPHITVYGKNVYIQWINNVGNVAFDASHNNGVTWDAIKVLTSAGIGPTPDPEISTAGSNVYVNWEDKSVDASGDINSTVISNNGTVVVHKNNVSGTSGQTSEHPQIASFKSSVYETWQEKYSSSTGDIFFATSSNNGTSFGSKINLSNSAGFADNPQIAANASKVYVAWQDSIAINGKNDILFAASANNGTTFGSTINLSNNTDDSTFPKVALSGNNVYVVWQDKTIHPGSTGGDILFRASSDNGATFGGLKKLDTTATDLDNRHQISASSKNISVAWSDSSGNVDYISSIYSPIEVQFSAAQYSLISTATITVTDPSANTNPNVIQTVSAAVKSQTDATGIAALTLTETGVNTGIFSGTITFTFSGSTSGTTLKATSGDVITATYNGQSSIASILPITIAFDSPAGYDRGAISHITITDQDANHDTTKADTITVHLTSIANPTGIDLQLTETGVNTGIFGSTSSDKLIFMDTNNLFPSTGTVTINQTNTGANVNHNAIETVSEQVNSTSDAVGITMNLNETGVNTGIFSGRLTLGSSSINHIAIKVAPGDFVRVTRGTATENALITPNPNSSNGALLVTADPSVDTVTASYKGVTKNVSVSRLFSPGGSGGGLVRPGLVLNAIAGLAHGDSGSVSPSFDLSNFAAVPGALPDNIKLEVLNQDPLKPIPPSHDSSFNFPFYIGDNGYPLAHYTNTLSPNIIKTGDPVQVKLNIPATGLVHVALYTDIHGTVRDVYHSDTYIIYDKGQPLQVVDPHGFFAPHTGFDLTTVGANNAISFKITFAKPMEESDIDLRAWNDHQASSETKILDAWQVEPSSSTLSSQIAPATTSTITPATTVPSTTTPMQNTAPTTETTPDLMPAIKDWGGYSPNPISDSDLLAKIGIQGQHIPSWVAKTTKWVVDGNVTPQEFENLVKYLASAGIVK